MAVTIHLRRIYNAPPLVAMMTDRGVQLYCDGRISYDAAWQIDGETIVVSLWVPYADYIVSEQERLDADRMMLRAERMDCDAWMVVDGISPLKWEKL